MIKQYFINIIWALDRLANTFFGGSSKEFISTRVYNYKDKNNIAYIVYRILNWIDPMHCENASKRDNDPEHSKEDLANQ